MKGIHRIDIGDEAPDFTLPATGLRAGEGPPGTSVTLSGYRGTRNVFLAFFPAAFTPV